MDRMLTKKQVVEMTGLERPEILLPHLRLSANCLRFEPTIVEAYMVGRKDVREFSLPQRGNIANVRAGGISLYLRGRVFWAAYQMNGQSVRRSTGTLTEVEARSVVQSWIDVGAVPQPPIRIRTEPCTTYFMEAVGSGRVKIGQTRTPIRERISSIQCGCPFPLKVIAEVAGDVRLERQLHRRFAHLRIMPNAEWFHLTDEIREYLASVVQQ